MVPQPYVRRWKQEKWPWAEINIETIHNAKHVKLWILQETFKWAAWFINV